MMLRLSQWCIALLAAAPLGWLVLLYAFVLRARLHLGHWPSPYKPDPKDLGFVAHHAAVWSSFDAALACCGVAVIWTWVLYWRKDRRLAWRITAQIASGVAGVIICLFIDPGHFFEWFVD